MMFGCVGDIHSTNKQPENRLDKYSDTLLEKFMQIVRGCKKRGIKYIFVPGDFFDHHTMPDSLKRKIILLLYEEDIILLCVPGQHDLRYHNSKIENTPLGLIAATPHMEIIEPDKPFKEVFYNDNNTHHIHIYGAGWGQDIPTIEDPEAANVLLTHRMIINDKKLWEAQEDYTRANYLLRSTEFDLIVSGDNHQGFVHESGTKKLVNCGSLMRKNIDQVNHRPMFCIWNSIDKSLEKIYLDVKPFKEVMNIEVAEKEKVENEKLKKFMERIQNKSNVSGIDFSKNVSKYETDSDLDEYTLDALQIIMS